MTAFAIRAKQKKLDFDEREQAGGINPIGMSSPYAQSGAGMIQSGASYNPMSYATGLVGQAAGMNPNFVSALIQRGALR